MRVEIPLECEGSAQCRIDVQGYFGVGGRFRGNITSAYMNGHALEVHWLPIRPVWDAIERVR